MRRLITTLLIAGSVGALGDDVFALTYRMFDHPLAVNGTSFNGIDGNHIVGRYTDAAGLRHGFLFDGSSYTAIDDPNGDSTTLRGISGNNILGYYTLVGGISHTFIFDGSAFTDLAGFFTVGGISNGRVVGNTSNGAYFIYDIASAAYTPMPQPPLEQVVRVVATDISGSNIVGNYIGYNPLYDARGFLWNGSSFVTLDNPSSVDGTSGFLTYPKAISGTNVIGTYFKDGNSGITYNFFYDGSKWTDVEIPGGHDLSLEDLQGNTIVGRYTDGSGVIHAFMATLLTGDANFDGIINGQDIAMIASSWLHTGIGGPGDVNDDGIVNGQDVALISSNWLGTMPSNGNAAAAPEPSTLILAALGGLVLLAWRRR